MTVAENEARPKEPVSQPMIDEALAAELERDGAEFTCKDMLVVTRDQPCWFDEEKGRGRVKERAFDDCSCPYSAAHSP